VIANNTKYELDLDLDESCGRECDHKGDFTTLLYNNNAQIMSLVAHQIGGNGLDWLCYLASNF
jgi:hypothetical protein